MNRILLSILAITIQTCQPGFAATYIKGPALHEGVTSTATAAGTTTLTKDSETIQVFTGATTQTVVLPDATTLSVGRYFEFYNLSSGAVTVNANGGSLQRTLAASDHSKITLLSNGSAAGTWAVEKITIALTDSLLTGTLSIAKGGTGQTSFSTGILKSNGSALSSSAVGLSTADVTGTLPIANGGTGQTGANAAFNALAPSQGSNSGKYLTTNGTDTSWATVDALPSQTGNSGKLLTTNGTAASWLTATDVGLPTQTGNSGKFLTTNGTSSSWATAGLSTQGQSEGSSVTTTLLKAPYNQLTTTGTDERVIETANNNLLENPSFEHSSFATGWSALDNTTPTVETTEIRHGKKSAKLVTNAQSGYFWCNSVTPTIKMSGMTLEYSLKVKTDQSGVKVCAMQADVKVGTCADVSSNNAWGYFGTTYPGPSSGSVGVCLYHATGVTGTIYVDDAYMGDAWGRSLGVASSVTNWESTTVTGTWTSNTTYTAKKRRVGDSYEYQVLVSLTGAPNAVALSLTIPDTIDTSKLVGGTSSRAPLGTARAYDNGVQNYGPYSIVYGGTNTLQTYITDSSGAYTTQPNNITNAVPFSFGNTDSIEITFSIPATGTPTQNIVSTSQAEFAETDCPTITGSWVTNTTYTCKWYRRKNRAYFDVKVATSGAPTSTTLSVNLPITIDTAKMTDPVATITQLGRGLAFKSGVDAYGVLVSYNNTTSVSVNAQNSSATYLASAALVTQAVPFTFASGDSIRVQFDVPVVGWIDNPIPAIPQSVIARDNSTGVTTINTVVSKTADYTATVDEETILVDSSGGTRTITLPAAAGVKGKKYEIIATSASNSVTIDPNSTETVCGQASIKLTGLRDSVIVQSDGTNWQGLLGTCSRTVTAGVTSTGVVTEAVGGDWVNGNCAVTDTSLYTCTLQTGIFTNAVAPTCTTNVVTNSVGSGTQFDDFIAAGSFKVRTYLTTSKIAAAFYVTCTGPR